jgi:hypothetical protein
LIRYHIEDKGGVQSFERVLAFARSHGFDPLGDPLLAGAPVRKMVMRPRW